MNVTLPDGTIVKDIPDGTTKAQLAEKLKANGHTVPDEWLTPIAPKKTDSAMDFISGNINKGIAGALGAPVDTMRNVANLGIAGAGSIYGALGGKNLPELIPENSIGGSQWIEQKMRNANLVNESSTPTSTAGKVSAVGLQILPSLIDPIARGSMKVPGAVDEMVQSTKPLAGKIGQVVSDIKGSGNAGLRDEALQATKSAVQSGLANTERAASREAKIQSYLEEAKRPDVENTLDIQGGKIRNFYSDAIQKAKQERATAADQGFSEVRKEALARESAGHTVDVSHVQSQLMDFVKDAEGVPGLETQAKGLLKSITGRTKEPGPPAIVDATGKPFAPPEVGNTPKTFDQLELTRRYLNDIAYNGETEGYSAIIRNKAKDTAKAIDKAMQDFAPSFTKYKNQYAEMSKPLESFDTRLGKVLSGTEGGLGGTAYNKIANSDLPNKLFAKKEGVELLVDALSGGKNVEPKTRELAQKQVDQMVENWIVESTRGKSGIEALKQIQAPGMQGTLSSTPNLVPKLTSKFESRSAMEKMAGSGKSAALAEKMKLDMTEADHLMTSGSYELQQKGVKIYENLLKRENIPPEQYRAALQYIDRSASAEERTERLRTLVKRIGGYGGAGLAAYETYKLAK